jgi:hypothetical protein
MAAPGRRRQVQCIGRSRQGGQIPPDDVGEGGSTRTVRTDGPRCIQGVHTTKASTLVGAQLSAQTDALHSVAASVGAVVDIHPSIAASLSRRVVANLSPIGPKELSSGHTRRSPSMAARTLTRSLQLKAATAVAPSVKPVAACKIRSQQRHYASESSSSSVRPVPADDRVLKGGR